MRDPGDAEPTEAFGPEPAASERTEVLPAVDAWTPVPPPPRRAAPPAPDYPPPPPGAVPRFAAPPPGRALPGAVGPEADQPRYGWGQGPGLPAQGRPSFAPPAGVPTGAPWGTPPAAVPPSAAPQQGWQGQQPGWAPPHQGWAPPQGWAPQQGWQGQQQQGWPQQGWAAPQPAWGAPAASAWSPARPSTDDLVWAPAAHWLPLLTHWVGPLVVLLTAGRRSERVRAEAVASLNWEITVAILLAVATALAPFGLVAPGLALGTVAVSVGLHVFGAVTVARGGRFTYPGALPFIS